MLLQPPKFITSISSENRDEILRLVLEQDQQLPLRYLDHQGQATEHYPYNPNGSTGGYTSLCNQDGRITVMMPHPERVFRSVQYSWCPSDWDEDSPWLQFFTNVMSWYQKTR